MTNSNKLVVVIMGQNCKGFIRMCLNSVEDADAIVYCDGGSTDNTISLLDGYGFYLPDSYFEFKTLDGRDRYTKEGLKEHKKERLKRCVIENKYDQEDMAMNGKQRNFYLDNVKKNYPG